MAYEAANKTPGRGSRNRAGTPVIRNALLVVLIMVVAGSLGYSIASKSASSQDLVSSEASAPDALGNTTAATGGMEDDSEQAVIKLSTTSEPVASFGDATAEGDADGIASSGYVSSSINSTTSAIDSGDSARASSGDSLVNDPAQTGPNGYVLPQSATHLYTESELSGLDLWGLCVARNEIPGRHGFIFDRDDLISYFGQKTWYKGTLTRKEFRSIVGILNEVEEANVATILAMEQARNSPYVPTE